MKNTSKKSAEAEIKFITECRKAYNDFGNSKINNEDFLVGTSDFATSLIASNCQMLDEEDVGKYLDDTVEIIRKKIKVMNELFEGK